MNAHVDTSTGTAVDFARVFAEFSAGLDPTRLSPEVIAAARLNIYDTLACSIAGRHAPGADEMVGLVGEWGGAPQAQVLWTDLRVPAPQAAWVNGIMSHACDYDDTHDKAILHGGISVIPAALAAAEIAGRPVSGAELYAGVAVGLEMICRVGVATRIGLIQAGFIYSALFSCFAAAAAGARILRLTPDQTVDALGIAFTQAAGTHQVTRDGALTKRMQPGFGAKAGLIAVEMARRGIRGAQNVFEGIDGLNRIYLQNELDSDILREGLGSRFHFTDLSYKPYPCCRMNHTAIDAALRLREQSGFDVSQVTEITARINSQGNQAVGTPLDIRRAPKNVVQAQFSICYNIACALVQGRVGLSDFTQEALSRPEILAVAAKVTPIVDEQFEREMGRNVTPARVEAVQGGQVFEAEVREAKGNFTTPMTDTEMRRKVEDCLTFAGFDPARADAFEAGVAKLETSTDVAADLRALSDAIRA